MTELEFGKVMTGAGPWAVALILLFIVYAFMDGRIISQKVLDKIVTEISAKTLQRVEQLVGEHTAKSAADHQRLLDAIQSRPTAKTREGGL